MTLILGLESSCDETAAALVDSDGAILRAQIARQEEANIAPMAASFPRLPRARMSTVLAPLVEACWPMPA
jgi:N6-L-threonylcarbamoyladenine synthase